MNIYKVHYPGKALGGLMIVLAINKHSAFKQATEELKQRDITPDRETIRIENAGPLKTVGDKPGNPVMPQIVHDWDGDY